MRRVHLALIALALVPSASIASAPPGSDAPGYRTVATDAYRGIARPWRLVTLASTVDGTLAEITVQEGELVPAGALLGRLDDTIARASVEVARLNADTSSRIEQAKIAVERAEADLADLESMQRARSSTPREIRDARVAAADARAALAIVKDQQAVRVASLALEEARLAQHRIRAPFAGRVVRVHVEPGTAVNDATPILDVAQLHELKAEIQVDARHYGALTVGTPYLLDADAPITRSLYGTLVYADHIIDPAAGTFRCVFSISNEERTLPAGFTVTLRGEVIDAVTTMQTMAADDCPE